MYISGTFVDSHKHWTTLTKEAYKIYMTSKTLSYTYNKYRKHLADHISCLRCMHLYDSLDLEGEAKVWT